MIIGINALTASMVAATYIMLFGGFEEPLLPARILYFLQVALLFIFIAEKIVRFFNSSSKVIFAKVNWFEVPLLLILLVTVIGAGNWFATTETEQTTVLHYAVGIYLVLQVVIKLCRTSINLAASGRNPTQTLIASFVVANQLPAPITVTKSINKSGTSNQFTLAKITFELELKNLTIFSAIKIKSRAT
ncbi:hypothetical protein ACFLZ8_03135 [Planctomycetota bacterium]